MSETISETSGKIVWFELPAEDTRRARGFYGRLFGWQFQAFEGPFEYHMTYEAGGAIMSSQGQKGPVVYFGVADIDAASARVRELGGKADERQEIPGVGLYAHCTDTEGNPFSLFQAAEAS
jgi:predicted enzyme related to lactoylglutathione lyase